MRIALLYLTEGGRRLAKQLARRLPDFELIDDNGKIVERLARLWPRYDGFVCIMAAGIVVRAVAPLVRDKRTDPCVVVMDEMGRFVVSLLSGHLGGGNDLARRVSAVTNGQAVITTASDILEKTAIDLWAREHNLYIAHPETLTRASGILVNQGRLLVYSDVTISLPDDFFETGDPDKADLIISYKTGWPGERPVLHPGVLVIGVGCNRGTLASEFEEALATLFAENGLAVQAVRNLASIDLKKEEQGLLDFAGHHGWPIDFYNKDELNNVSGVSCSDAVMQATGAKGVAEPAALLSARTAQLLIRKQKWQNLTMAVADCMSSAPGRAI